MAYGTVNADVIQSSVSGVSLGAGNASIMKNRIINGAMVISQRGTSFTPANADYTLDRWQTLLTQSSKFTVAQSSTAPTGFNNSLLVTSSSAYSVAAGDFFGVQQKIEGYNIADLGWGTASAKTVTLSFQVYSSLTGTFGGSLFNSASNRSYPFSYSVPVANTWTTISVTIAGDTTGTWLTTNGSGIQVFFNLGTGSTYSGTAGAWAAGLYFAPPGATSVVGTNGATFYITGVQLEVGTSATGFEYRQYQQELALCQRYYEKTYNATVAPATVTNDGAQITNITCDGSGGAFVGYSFKVSKCTTPTITAYTTGGTAGSWGYSRNGASGNGAVTTGFLGQNGFYLSTATGGTWVAVQVNGHWTASAEL